MKSAPIRQKFDVLLAGLGGLGIVNAGVAALVWQGAADADVGLGVALATLVATLAGLLGAKAAICGPYVSTVVRMEKLAAGDLQSPIAYTDHMDCVGRMTKAMEVFRQNALALEKANSDHSQSVVAIVSDALDRLAEGDLTCRIENMPEGDFARLQAAFNASAARIEQLIAAVRATVGGVRTGSDEIRAASEDLALRNEQQAASLEETAASVGAV
ncbi:MAG: methyl-accepting chemotaxis protein, partial [Porphyrobacter sp.]|nr:methyl-accepting chemotaxis protein [Porphyrobacter sp.]